jgi:putative Mn2+ efflux pump MntP
MKVGILLVTIGLIWLGARLGLLDFSWLQAVYFWPAVFILLGVWMVHKGFRQGKPRTFDDKTEEV